MIAPWSAAMVPSTSRIRRDRSAPGHAMKADGSSSAAWSTTSSLLKTSSQSSVTRSRVHRYRRRLTSHSGRRRGEERLGRRRPPVEQEPAAVAVGEPEPSDVHRLRSFAATMRPRNSSMP
jgi:hypothetical protein